MKLFRRLQQPLTFRARLLTLKGILVISFFVAMFQFVMFALWLSEPVGTQNKSEHTLTYLMSFVMCVLFFGFIYWATSEVEKQQKESEDCNPM